MLRRSMAIPAAAAGRRSFAGSARSLQVLETIEAFRSARKQLPPTATLGLVPTMGVSVLLSSARIDRGV